MTFNHGVEGSSPSALTNKIRCLAENPRFTQSCVGKSIAAQPRAIAHSEQSTFFYEPEAEFSPILVVLRQRNQREERMTKFRLIGAAAVLAVLAGPASARHAISSPAQSIFCATREAGNPHSKYCDYIAWSKWRQRGAWDSSLDNACLFNPRFIPGECSFNAQGQVLFGAHP